MERKYREKREGGEEVGGKKRWERKNIILNLVKLKMHGKFLRVIPKMIETEWVTSKLLERRKMK
jgi:hypothetical protein